MTETALRSLDKNTDGSLAEIVGNESHRTYIETRPAEVVANIIVCLIHQTNFLLDQQIRALEKAFVAEGGLRERMTRARLSERSRQSQSDQDSRRPSDGN